MKAIERLVQYIDYKGFSNRSFEMQIGLSNGYIGTQLKRNADLGESILNKILDNCLDINPIWLISGKGDMLKNTETRTLYWRDSETDENIANKINEIPAFEVDSNTIAQIRLEALHDKEKIIVMLEKDNERLEKELQDQKRENEQLKKELSLASSSKVGVKSDG